MARAGSSLSRRMCKRMSIHSLSCGLVGCKLERDFLFGLRSNCCGCAIQKANASAIAFSLERRRLARSPWNCQCKSAGSLTVVLIVELELIRPRYSSLASSSEMQTPNGARAASIPRVGPAFFCGRLCSSIRTNGDPSFKSFIRSQSWMQEICSEFRTNRRLNSGCSVPSVSVRGQARDAQAWCLGSPALLLGVYSRDRCGAPPEVRRHKCNTIRLHFAIKSGTLAVLLLANRWYLLYKV